MEKKVSLRGMSGSEVAQTVLDWLNVSGLDDHRDFSAVMTHAHRTLQQEFFSLVLVCIRDWAKMAKDECRYDARNEATVKGAAKIVEALEGHAVPFI